MNQAECARLETRGGEPVMLKGVKVNGVLRGLLFEASVEQRFLNPTDKSVEVVYTFPLPWDAVLLGVEVQLGDKHLTGAVVEKKQAEARYEAALSEGDAAIMLERNHDQSYSLNLGNLAPKEECVITLRYSQALQFQQRGLRLVVPTVIAPRYGDDVIDGGLQPHQATSHDLLSEYPFDIELRLHGELTRARVASPSHPVSVVTASKSDGPVVTVSLARKGAMDRDFVLVLDQLAHDSLAVAAKDSVEPDGVVAMLSFCPRMKTGDATNPAAVAVKLLVDCSGSMAGDSIEAAKRALQAIVLQLGKGDRFSLSRFGDKVEHRSRGLWSATETTKLAAKRWVGNLEADMGGTEMEGAMGSTFALAQSLPGDVLLVTDGEISAIDRTIESAKASGHRLFIVGIGSSPAESHLRRLAEVTGGACDFVAPGEAVEPAVLRMFARLRSPRLTHLSVAWLAGGSPKWMSELSASVFDGDTVNVYALLKLAPQGEVRLLGTRPGTNQPEEIACVRFDGVVQTGDTLSRVAALQRVRSAAVATNLNSTQAIQLAVAYQLVTDWTNFLLVHGREEADKATDMPNLHKVPQMLAAGWGGSGSVLSSRSQVVFREPSAPRVWSSPSSTLRSINEPSAPYRAHGIAAAPRGMEDFEIPAFSRKQTNDPVSVSTPRDFADLLPINTQSQNIDPAARQYWSESESYVGLNPLGVCEWLHRNAMAAWPTSYAELRRIGLGTPVLDWLELHVAGREDGARAERKVVEAFLYVIAQRDINESLVVGLGLLQRFKGMGQRLRTLLAYGSKPVQAVVDARLVEDITADLHGMTADTWPEQVFALGTSVDGG